MAGINMEYVRLKKLKTTEVVPDDKKEFYSHLNYRPIFVEQTNEDWYEFQKKVNPSTIKLLHKENGRIVCASFDVSMLSPIGYLLSEVEATNEIQTEKDTDKIPFEYILEDGKLTKIADTTEYKIKKAENEINQEKILISEKIAELQDAVDLGRATKEQEARLLELKHYRVDLLNLDPDKDFDKEWRKPL